MGKNHLQRVERAQLVARTRAAKVGNMSRRRSLVLPVASGTRLGPPARTGTGKPREGQP